MEDSSRTDWFIDGFVENSILSGGSFRTEKIEIGTFFSVIKHSCVNKTTDLKKIGFIEQDPEHTETQVRTKKIFLEPTKEQQKILNLMFKDYYLCYNAAVTELYIYLLNKNKEHMKEIDKVIKDSAKIISENKDFIENEKLPKNIKNILEKNQKKIKNLFYTSDTVPKHYLEHKIEKELQGKVKWLHAHTIRRACRQVQSAYKTMMTLKRKKIKTKSGKYILSIKDVGALKVKTMTLPPIYIKCHKVKDEFKNFICKKFLGEIKASENLSEIKKDCKLQYNGNTGKWILFVPYNVKIEKPKKAKNKVAAIDGGVSTYHTLFSENHVMEIYPEDKSVIIKLFNLSSKYQGMCDKLFKKRKNNNEQIINLNKLIEDSRNIINDLESKINKINEEKNKKINKMKKNNERSIIEVKNILNLFKSKIKKYKNDIKIEKFNINLFESEIEKIKIKNRKIRSKLNKPRRKWKLTRNKLKNKISDSQWKVVNYLCKNYQTIIIGKLNTQSAIKKKKKFKPGEQIDVSNKKELPKMVKRLLSSLSHYKFRSRLIDKGIQYRRSIIVQDEGYTSKTCLNCGKIHYKLGVSREYHCPECDFQIKRDIGGAGGILMKSIYKKTENTSKIV